MKKLVRVRHNGRKDNHEKFEIQCKLTGFLNHVDMVDRYFLIPEYLTAGLH